MLELFQNFCPYCGSYCGANHNNVKSETPTPPWTLFSAFSKERAACQDKGGCTASNENGPEEPKKVKQFSVYTLTTLGAELVDVVNVLRGLEVSEEKIRQTVIGRTAAGAF